ncbi:MAG: TIGR03790 family protein [Verrucomicrobia bacterium]|nr:TIGR03790 family protein [Verrucomicrobiota bacterium]MBM3871301.1 TIGR03790 family protein [Verrucomicrobiota bacterium]
MRRVTCCALRVWERAVGRLAQPAMRNPHRAAILLAIFLQPVALARPAASADTVFVLYNSASEDSKSVAAHYFGARRLPGDRLLGLSLPTGETMSRAEFREQLQEPLLKALAERGLWKTRADVATRDFNLTNLPAVTESQIRYLVLCHGVPIRIASDKTLTETGADKLQPELRRNEAAVDSELAALPLALGRHLLTSALPNRNYAATNTAALHPTNGILLVARLDGPSATLARGLVDKAMQAERDGLWGRAYFDARGITNGGYLTGDEWLRKAAETMRRFGLETMLDDTAPTFSAGFPLSQVGLYAGWYDGNVSGPFKAGTVEFLPGAVAYHLHSFSAHTLRSADKNWCGPLLARGATATMGCVEEPFLAGTPDLGVFFHRLTAAGWTFGESAYAAQGSLSWQTTVIGDPLYQPFGRHPAELHADLLKRRSPLVAWSHLRVVNLNLARGASAAEMVGYLNQQAETKTSPELLEKIGDLQLKLEKPELAVEAWDTALANHPTPQQRIRLLQARADALTKMGRDVLALAAWQQLVGLLPPSPELDQVNTRLEEAKLKFKSK